MFQTLAKRLKKCLKRLQTFKLFFLNCESVFEAPVYRGGSLCLDGAPAMSVDEAAVEAGRLDETLCDEGGVGRSGGSS